MSVRNTALTWLGCFWRVVLGIVSGAALTLFCLISLGGVLSFWAIPAGSISALASWIVIVIASTVSMRFRGWNFARIQFLAGLGVIPCWAGTTMLIASALEGWVNPFF
ncbi:hypothetical protein [Nocardia asiatica]|uniref:hypothetical protein n=1 Tax=Nocardia asiatica TaxID=209252 RepID=UPI0024554E04|nr:hypothetical protein [Nocardia asiatica]